MNRIVLFTRVPGAVPAKTRLLRELGVDEDVELPRALLLDTLEAVRIASARVVIAFDPPEGETALAALAPGYGLVAQRGDHLGSRMAAAIGDQLASGASRVVLVGSDLPGLRSVDLAQAFALLAARPDVVVMSPTSDGGYGCIGMTRVHPSLFETLRWGTPTVYEETCARARHLGIPLLSLPVIDDVDTAEDFNRLLRSNPTDVPAPRTRAWARARGWPRT